MSVCAMSFGVKALPQDRLSPMFIHEIGDADALHVFNHVADVFDHPNCCSHSVLTRHIR